MAHNPADLFDVQVDERLPWFKSTALGFQHILGMTGMFVLPGIMGHALHLSIDQISYLYGVTFIVAGLATILQAIFAIKLPIVQSTFAGNFVAMMTVAHSAGAQGLAYAYGSMLIASVIWLVIFLLAFQFNLLRSIIKAVDTPLYRGILIVLVMFQLMNVAFPGWLSTPPTS